VHCGPSHWPRFTITPGRVSLPEATLYVPVTHNSGALP
jgi:hypothetical protein